MRAITLPTILTLLMAATDVQAAVTNTEIGAGLREALTVGTVKVVNRLGQSGGFTNDPLVHIPLPKGLKKVKSALDAVGMGGALDDLEIKMNRAAEVATPKAKQLFVDAIKQMSLDDVKAIYNGPQDAATRYFQSKMSAPLAEQMTPVVNDSLAQVGAVKSYDKAMANYRKLPLVPDVKADLTQHVVKKGIDGVFHYLALEEAAIRQDPLKRTTSLLQQVFGAK
ncbi:MAG: DUF4197 domain-containing protein [Gammaproteobacteria bacterium]